MSLSVTLSGPDPGPAKAAPECTANVKLDQETLASLYTAYLRAGYLWGSGGNWQPVVIGEPVPSLEAAHPQVRRFGMVSAWNPVSVEQSEPVNRAEDERLRATIRGCGHAAVPGFASAPNRTWREPNWVVFDISAVELDALAREFGQLGTLYWERGQPVRLRMDAPRPEAIGPHPHVDWIQ